MVFVILVGLVVSLAFSLFMTSTVLVESRAVEGELAKSRAYWAEMGTFHYAMSRISRSKFCSSCVIPNINIKDTVLAANLQSYFDELGSLQTWTYPDECPATPLPSQTLRRLTLRRDARTSAVGSRRLQPIPALHW